VFYSSYIKSTSSCRRAILQTYGSFLSRKCRLQRFFAGNMVNHHFNSWACGEMGYNMVQTSGFWRYLTCFFCTNPRTYCPTHVGKGDTAHDLYNWEIMVLRTSLTKAARHFRVKFFRSTAPKHREKCQQAAMAAAKDWMIGKSWEIFNLQLQSELQISDWNVNFILLIDLVLTTYWLIDWLVGF